LGHQRTGGIHHAQIAELARLPHGWRNPVGAVDQALAVRDFIHLINKDRSLGLEFLNHIAVMDDLFADVDGRAKGVQGNADDINGTNHPGTKTTGLKQKQSLRFLCCHYLLTDYTLSATTIYLSLIN